MEARIIKGRDAIESLAKRFPQLYVAPAEGAQKAHRLASGMEIVPEGADPFGFLLDLKRKPLIGY